jgi:hypothetical protein
LEFVEGLVRVMESSGMSFDFAMMAMQRLATASVADSSLMRLLLPRSRCTLKWCEIVGEWASF